MKRAKKKWRLKRIYLAGRLKDEVNGAQTHYKRYESRGEELKKRIRKRVQQYDEAKVETQKWMKRYYALKRHLRLSDAQRAKEKREREAARLEALRNKKGPSMKDLLSEEKANREKIDDVGNKYAKSQSSEDAAMQKIQNNLRDEQAKEKISEVKAKAKADLQSKIFAEKAKGLEGELKRETDGGLPKESQPMMLILDNGGDDYKVDKDKALQEELKNPDCSDCEKE